MKLLGSTTSPFVRRLRLYMFGQPYEFINLDIFSEAGREILTANNPAQKVPALIDEEQCIFDSRVIYRYLAEKRQEEKLTWQQENTLTLIDAANDSLVTLFLSKRSGLDINQDVLFFNLQHERVEQLFSVLNQAALNHEFENWNYPAICLFCLLDWAKFREMYDWEKLPALVSFYNQAQTKEGVKVTDPR
ncbi:glutathione S-transferase family protein [Colwelliaceae bacterium 6471]